MALVLRSPGLLQRIDLLPKDQENIQVPVRLRVASNSRAVGDHPHAPVSIELTDLSTDVDENLPDRGRKINLSYFVPGHDRRTRALR